MKIIPARVITLFLLVVLINSGYPKKYKGAELRTRESFKYGRFEARLKPAKGEGLLASLFTYNDNLSGSQEWNEIDIEILGYYADNVQFNTITPGIVNHESRHYVPFNTQMNFHTYGFEWTPDYVAWFVDGTEEYRQTGEHISSLNFAQKLMMNTWIPESSDWVGEWDPRLLPKFSNYDWASYASYTPGEGNTGTDQNFTLQWKDEFDSLKTERWQRANHTWSGNQTDFLPENAVFENGNLILCLTDDTNLGNVDITPPYVLWARGQAGTINISFSEKLDSSSAQTKSNYSISGLSIEQAILLPDQQTVTLKVSAIDTSANYSLVILGIQDASLNHNKQLGQVIPINLGRSLSFPIKINIGGPAIYGEFLADQKWGPTVEYGHLDGSFVYWNGAISGTEQDLLYNSSLDGAAKYKIRVASGMYTVILHLAENEKSEVEQRKIKFVIEDGHKTELIDLISKVGAHSAYDIELKNISVNDGILDIHLVNELGHSVLNGLTIEQESTAIHPDKKHALKNLKLYHNSPNPFNPSTVIALDLPKSQFVQVTLFNTMGQKVKTILDQFLAPGNHQILWDGKNENGAPLPSGVYFALARTESNVQAIKMILMR